MRPSIIIYLSILFLYLLTPVNSQIEQGESDFKLFFDNYTGVLILRNFHNGSTLPSVAFHPVVGGSDIKYVRYNNSIACNITAAEEVDLDGNIVASVSLMDLKWNLTHNYEMDEETGNEHYCIILTTVNAPDGIEVNIMVDSWTKGFNRTYYGTYSNIVAPNFVELSFNVTGWKFTNMANRFWVKMLLSLDDTGIPSIDSSNRMQYKGSITTTKTEFSIWLMTWGFLDDTFTPFTYDLRPLDLTFKEYTFILQSPSFNTSYQYDPNFAVLLRAPPDCTSLGGCHEGTCVDDDLCQCNRGYIGQNCSIRAPPNETSENDNTNPSSNKGIDWTPLYMWVGIGVAITVVCVIGGTFIWYAVKTRSSSSSLHNVSKLAESQRVSVSVAVGI